MKDHLAVGHVLLVLHAGKCDEAFLYGAVVTFLQHFWQLENSASNERPLQTVALHWAWLWDVDRSFGHCGTLVRCEVLLILET